MAVAADNRHAGLGQPELRPDDMHDALVDAAQRVQHDAVLGAVLPQSGDLRGRQRVRDRPGPGDVQADGGNVMVHRGDRQVGPPYLAAGQVKALERLGRGDLVHQVQVNVEERWLAVRAGHDVAVPDLVKEACSHVGTDSSDET